MSTTTKRYLQFDVTLRVEVAIDGEVSLPDAEIPQLVAETFHDYEDGRFPFNVEMVHSGVTSAVHCAINQRISSHVHAAMFPAGNPRTPEEFAARSAREQAECERVHVRTLDFKTTCTPSVERAICHVCGTSSYDADTWCVPCGAPTCELI